MLKEVAIVVVSAALVFSSLYYIDLEQSGNVPEPVPATCKGSAGCFYGTVTGVIDGDTITVDGHKIRLAIVDTPEEDEPGYAEATRFTSEMCPIGSVVAVDQDDLQTEGSYGRTIAEVRCGEVVLNEALLQGGMAVIEKKLCDESEFSAEKWATDFGC